MVDLTIRGNSTSKNRMITEQTLDREGFYLPEPPQRCKRRLKSAVGIGRREQTHKPFGDHSSAVNRPKSAGFSSNRARAPTSDIGYNGDKIKQGKNYSDWENQEEINHDDFMKAKKMTVNQKWVYRGEDRKWKPRNSQVRENSPSRLNQCSKDKNIKQRISVCEVMAKMKSDSSDHSNGASAPPSSPKVSTSAIVGQNFVNASSSQDFDSNDQSNMNYLHYAKSKNRLSRDKSIARKSVSFLQEDMTITSQPSRQRQIIQIPSPNKEMFSTDEPDEESEVVVESKPGRPRVAPVRGTQNKIYRSIYLNNYRENNFPTSRDSESGHKENVRLERPKSTNHVRYCPNTYRFHDQQYTRDFVQNADWDRVQPRLPVGNSRSVSSRRPTNSLYVGTS